MTEAGYPDKALVVDILSRSFADNPSVNFIIRQDRRKPERIRKLMEYSFTLCYHYGKVYLSDNKKGCALLLFPHLKKTSARTLLADARLILFGTGITNLRRVAARESTINKLQPKPPFHYLWFIGVHPFYQHQGIGSGLLNNVTSASERDQQVICLETSVPANIPWYRKFGFSIYHELNFGYPLYLLKREPGH